MLDPDIHTEQPDEKPPTTAPDLLPGSADAGELIPLQRWHCLGILSTGLAHEFNNSMMTILLSLGLLQKMSDLTEGQQTLIKQMHTAVMQAAQNTARFLDFARPSASEVIIFDANVIVRQAFELVANRLPQAVTPIVELSPKPLWCKADPRYIQQAVLNCLLNSVEALKTGGFLHVHTKKSSKEPEAQRNGIAKPEAQGQDQDILPALEYLVITISDSGEGMPPNLLADPFKPLQSSKCPGRGLGLFATRLILNFYQGHIMVAPCSPRGTLVTLYLPLTREQ